MAMSGMAAFPARSRAMAAWAAAGLGFTLPLSTAGDGLMELVLLAGWMLSGDWGQRWRQLRDHRLAWAVGALLVLAGLGTLWGLGSGADKLRYLSKYSDLLVVLVLVSLPLTALERERAL